jgi:hypothetical protein
VLPKPVCHRKSQTCALVRLVHLPCYSTHNKGYRCFDPLSNRVIISRHIIFDESSFPFAEQSTQPTSADSDFLEDLTNAVPAPIGSTSPFFAGFPGAFGAHGGTPSAPACPGALGAPSAAHTAGVAGASHASGAGAPGAGTLSAPGAPDTSLGTPASLVPPHSYVRLVPLELHHHLLIVLLYAHRPPGAARPRHLARLDITRLGHWSGYHPCWSTNASCLLTAPQAGSPGRPCSSPQRRCSCPGVIPCSALLASAQDLL